VPQTSSMIWSDPTTKAGLTPRTACADCRESVLSEFEVEPATHPSGLCARVQIRVEALKATLDSPFKSAAFGEKTTTRRSAQHPRTLRAGNRRSVFPESGSEITLDPSGLCARVQISPERLSSVLHSPFGTLEATLHSVSEGRSAHSAQTDRRHWDTGIRSGFDDREVCPAPGSEAVPSLISRFI
jgi:hypothetical protein